MNFRDYYGEPFRTDLKRVIEGLPSMHDHSPTEPEVTIQPRTLSRANQAIRLLCPERLRLFATALYFTVLVDQVMYTHFQAAYPRFRRLTQYPKLRGDCPGSCYWMLPPALVLRTAGLKPGEAQQFDLTSYADVVGDAVPVMEIEVTSFFQAHMPDVNGTDVWQRCVVHLPGLRDMRRDQGGQ